MTPLQKLIQQSIALINFEDPDRLPKIKEGEMLDYEISRHDATRAGLHRDVRIGNKKLGLLSWATKKPIPGPGERIGVFPQPVHPHSYLGFKGTIPEGQYGAGTVQSEHLGKALVTKSTKSELHYTDASRKGNHRYAMIRAKHGWMMTHANPLESPQDARKPVFKKVPGKDAGKALQGLPAGSVVQPKVDGALVNWTLNNRPEVTSHRVGKSGAAIPHTERVFQGRPKLDFPRKYKGRTILSELYGERKGKAIEPQELGGILNANLHESLKRQKAGKVNLKLMPFDIAGEKGSYPERMAKVREAVSRLPKDKYILPEEAHTPEEAQALFKRIKSGQHPLTKEGVIVRSSNGRDMKIKNMAEANVRVIGTYPGKGKYTSSHGGFVYGKNGKNGKEVGHVSSGLSDQTRKDLPNYIGRIFRIRHQGQYKSGAYRAPVAIAPDETKLSANLRTIQFMKMPPKGYSIPAKVTVDNIGAGLSGHYLTPQLLSEHRDRVISTLKQGGIKDERIKAILNRGEKGGIISVNRRRGDAESRITSQHEIIHSAQWQKTGFPKTKAKLLADEAVAYGGTMLGKRGKATGMSLPKRIGSAISGTIGSYKYGVKANNITRMFSSRAIDTTATIKPMLRKIINDPLIRLAALSERLVQFAHNEEGQWVGPGKAPKRGYKLIKPFLSGSDYDSHLGKAAAASVLVKKRAPIDMRQIEKPDVKGHLRTVVEKKSRRQIDALTKKPWFVEHPFDPDHPGEMTPFKPSHLEIPVEPYAKAKTAAGMVKHKTDLEKALVTAGRDKESQQAVHAKFRQEQRRASGESAPFKEIPHVQEGLRGEIRGMRSNIAETALEGRSIVRGYEKAHGVKLTPAQMPEVITRGRKHLDTLVEQHVKVNQEAEKQLGSRIHGMLYSKMKARLAEQGKDYRMESVERHLVPYVRAFGKDKEPHNIELEKHYWYVAELLGMQPKTTGGADHLESIQQLHSTLHKHRLAQTENGQALARKEFVKNGDLFNPERIKSAFEDTGKAAPHIKSKIRNDLTKFPMLKKIGIGGGIAAAGLAGIGAYKAIKGREKNKTVKMNSRIPVINFAKKLPKPPKLTPYAHGLLSKGEEGSKAISKATDLPKVLSPLGSNIGEIMEHIQSNESEIAKGVARKRRQALGLEYVKATPFGNKTAKSTEQKWGTLGEHRKIGAVENQFIHAKQAIDAGRTSRAQGIKGPGAIATRIWGGYIGRDPRLLPKRQLRFFNLDLAAMRKDEKAFNEHREWINKTTGGKEGQIGTMPEHRKRIAAKINKWRIQAPGAELVNRNLAGAKSEIESHEKTIGRLSGQLEEIRKAGQDFPTRIENARNEAIEESRAQMEPHLKTIASHNAAEREKLKGDYEHRTGELKKSIHKKIAIGTGAGVTAGAVGGYEAGKDKKKKEFSASTRIIQFNDRDKYKNLKRAGVIGGAGTAIAGMALLPSALSIMKIPGRTMIKGTRTGLSKIGGLTKIIKSPKADANLGGKMVADYLDASQQALNHGLHGKAVGAVLAHANRNPKGWISKRMGGDFQVSHFQRFRAGHLQALHHWDWEVAKMMEDRAIPKPNPHTGRMTTKLSPARLKQYQNSMHIGREKTHAAIEEQLYKHGKNESEAIRHVATNTNDPDIQRYFDNLAMTKAKASEGYAKKAIIAPGMIAGGGGLAAIGASDKKKKQMSAVGHIISFGIADVARMAHPLRDKDQGVSAHDIITGGIEGGVFTPTLVDPLIKAAQGQGLHSPFGGGMKGLGRFGKIALIGGASGALTTGIAGAAVNAWQNRKRIGQPQTSDQSMSSRGRLIQFQRPPTRTAVVQDRYKKHIREIDQDKAEGNYLKTGLSGGAIGGLLRKKMPISKAILGGAALGMGAQAIVRHYTGKTKDQFGDRSYDAKRVDRALPIIGGVSALGLAGKKIYDKSKGIHIPLKRINEAIDAMGKIGLSAKAKRIQFDDATFGEYATGEKPNRRSRDAVALDRYYKYSQRGGRLIRDIHATATGRKVLDARGREKRKEWDRPWVRNVIKGAILGTTVAGIAGVRHVAEHGSPKLSRAISNIQHGRLTKAIGNTMERKFPLYGQAMTNIRAKRAKVAEELASMGEGKNVGAFNEWMERESGRELPKPHISSTPGGSVVITRPGTADWNKNVRKGMTDAEIEEEKRQRRGINVFNKFKPDKEPPKTQLASKLRMIRFATPSPTAPGQYEDHWEDWLRSRPNVRKRQRREKMLHEKEENKKVIRQGIFGAGVVGGTAIGATFRRPMIERPIAEQIESVIKKSVEHAHLR